MGVVSFTPWPTYPSEKSPWCSFCGKLCGQRDRSKLRVKPVDFQILTDLNNCSRTRQTLQCIRIQPFSDYFSIMSWNSHPFPVSYRGLIENTQKYETIPYFLSIYTVSTAAKTMCKHNGRVIGRDLKLYSQFVLHIIRVNLNMDRTEMR
jgi:hypothetical protein